eukprot:Nitzschia sp. Nitz4//scaffold46_size129759//74534//76257//NITZ4_003509-RA/size129759-augustus-gene-0.10-mRNA-1//1//CDS//3329552619//4948//frame0
MSTTANDHHLSTYNTPSSRRWQQTSSSSEDDENQLFFVTSYTDFDTLAHGPKGTKAQHSIYVYRFFPTDGSLVLLNIQGGAGEVNNPAFSRFHPRLNVVYTCTEDCVNNGKIFAYSLKSDGTLEQMGPPVDAGGTSTCYLTIDRAEKNLLAVNYWNSTLVVIPLDEHTGAFRGPVQSVYDPKEGKEMVACTKNSGGANHSQNDASTIAMRQKDPHSHALVLDPYVGCVAYVPDLGKDVIREFLYDAAEGQIRMQMNVLPSGPRAGIPDGPRYFEFHPLYNVAYVVNELSSMVSVFEVDQELLKEIYTTSRNGDDMTRFLGRSTLRLVQSISTIPSAFPNSMNTCGRICVHKSGRFVIVSNRGHQSITVYKVKTKGHKFGELQTVGHFHTRGETPRHFQFDNSGQYLLVANQDSDSIAVFNFNLSNGEIKYSGNEYRIPSPNFVCCCPATQGEDEGPEIRQRPSFVMTAIRNSDVSDSEESTHPIRMGEDNENNLRKELAQAREEIENLKRRLAEQLKA